MKIHKGFQCKSCSSFLSHPIDVCPVCGDQFYWRIIYEQGISALQRDAFVASMTNLVEGRVTPEFLTHGDHLWLPYRFWGSDASGVTLQEFSWIEDLEVFQHENQKAVKPEVAVADTPKEPAPWDTLPKAPIPDFSQIEAAKAAAAALEASSVSMPEPEVRADTAAQAATPAQAKPVLREPSRARLKWGELLVPLLIFIFFVFLSLSYLTLLYYKNHMTPDAPEQSYLEDAHERFILS